MPVACRLRDGDYVVVNTDTGLVEFNHGSDQEACQSQASAINANTEAEMTTEAGHREKDRKKRGRSSEALELASFTPGGFVATLDDRDYPQLSRDRDRLLYHANRLVTARQSNPVEDVAGWSLLDMMRVHDALQEAMAATEDDFFDMFFEPEPGPMVENPPGEFIFVSREGGIHAHPLGDDGSATIGGRHSHAFLLDGVIHFTESDGAHQHTSGEADPETDEESDHEHRAFLADGTELIFAATSPHSHEKVVDTTVEDGLHEHTAKMDGGVEIKTLSPVDFRQLFGSAQEARAAEAVASYVAGMPTPIFAARVVEGEWNVTVIQAGLSKNLNFWPASLLAERGTEIFENVPLEVLKFDLVNHGHAPHNPHDLPAGVVQNSAGLITEAEFAEKNAKDEALGSKPTQEQAEAIARVMGWTVEKVFEESVGGLVAVAKTDGSEAGKDIEAKLEFADREGLLDNYLGLSVDIAEAKPITVNSGGQQIRVRPEINETRGVLVDFVSRPSAGGEVTGKAA